MHVRRSVRILVTSLLWAAACTSPGTDAPGGPRFVVLGDEVVRDTRTGLEWTRHDDGKGLGWYEADAYCQALMIDDARGWRLPGIEDLRGLYGATTRKPCGDAMCAIDPAFTLTSPYVWSATPQDPTSRAYLDFQFGTQLSPTITPRLLRRVLCVRTSAAGGRAHSEQSVCKPSPRPPTGALGPGDGTGNAPTARARAGSVKTHAGSSFAGRLRGYWSAVSS